MNTDPIQTFAQRINQHGYVRDRSIEGTVHRKLRRGERKVTWAARVPEDWDGAPNITHYVVIEGPRGYCKGAWRFRDGTLHVH